MQSFINHLAIPVLSLALLCSVGVAAGPPAGAAPSKIAQALQPFVDRRQLAGAVTLVADKDKILSLEAVGFADVAAAKPMRTDALFWIASQTKPMTAAALMMLVDEGKISLDDPVEKYLPEFKGQMVAVEQDEAHTLLKKPAHPITIRNILSHTSGLAFSSPIETPTLDALPLAVAVRSYASMPLQFEPDSKYQYSNEGINTAARILEVVSGMPYAEFMQQRLFEPLGMKDTTFWPGEAQIGRLARSYKPGAANTGLEATNIGQLQYPLSDRARRYAMPAGGLFSTASDVARFCQMILNGGELDGRRYVSASAVQQMTSRQTAPGLEGYGLGWSVGDGWFGHGGALATNMTVDTKRGIITVFLVQHAGFPGEGGQSHDAFQRAAVEQFGNH